MEDIKKLLEELNNMGSLDKREIVDIERKYHNVKYNDFAFVARDDNELEDLIEIAIKSIDDVTKKIQEYLGADYNYCKDKAVRRIRKDYNERD